MEPVRSVAFRRFSHSFVASEPPEGGTTNTSETVEVGGIAMRIIVNENVTGTVIRELRRRGYDVLSVKDSMRGADDTSILRRAEMEDRLVVTHDKDFGELAFRHRLPA